MSWTLAASVGCKKDEAGDSKPAVDLALKSGTTWALESSTLKLEKLAGGAEAERLFRRFANAHHVLLITDPHSTGVARFGVLADGPGPGTGSWNKARARGDHAFVRFGALSIRRTLEDGTSIELDVSGVRIAPGKMPDDGVVAERIEAQIHGGFSIQQADSRWSGDFFGEWVGRPDTDPPRIEVVPPSAGLVSGAFDVYFDEPVSSPALASQIFLRDSEQKPLDVTVRATELELDDHFTHVRVETNTLLPYGTDLSLAVGTGFADLSGIAPARPEVAIVRTPDVPPTFRPPQLDFARVRGEGEFVLQGDAELVDTWLGLSPHSGRLLRLRPPPPGDASSAALQTRLRVPSDASLLQVRVMKTAHTRDSPTPCLRFTVAHRSGVLHNVECGPTTVPRGRIPGTDADRFATEWVHLNIDLEGHRGQEVIVVLEARPLAPGTPPGMEPVLLVDLLRVVPEGADPTAL